jgi:hypothetical protein
MLTEFDFTEEDFAKNLLHQKIIAIVTEYTIFKLDLGKDRVVFRCLKNQFTFEVFFEEMVKELRLKSGELKDFLLESLVVYYAVKSQHSPKLLYPVCEFESFDLLFDWFIEWEKIAEAEKLAYLKKV